MRKPIQFDRKAIQTSINELEKLGPLANRGKLWERLSATYGVSVATVAKWANGLEIKTPLGKKGNPNTDFGRSKGIKTNLTRKRAGISREQADKRLAALSPRITPQVKQKLTRLYDLAIGGNKRAAIQIECLDCVCNSATENRLCADTSCTFHSIRPYKGKPKPEDEEK